MPERVGYDGAGGHGRAPPWRIDRDNTDDLVSRVRADMPTDLRHATWSAATAQLL
jgi:hypothetical protein